MNPRELSNLVESHSSSQPEPWRSVAFGVKSSILGNIAEPLEYGEADANAEDGVDIVNVGTVNVIEEARSACYCVTRFLLLQNLI